MWNLQTANDDQSKSQDSHFLKKKEMSKPLDHRVSFIEKSWQTMKLYVKSECDL